MNTALIGGTNWQIDSFFVNLTSGNYSICSRTALGCTVCDIVILNSLPQISGTDTRTECNSYTWIDGTNYTANNNSATFNITNGAANGCDSLVTLDLTIVNSTSGTDTKTECNSYTWIDGNTFTASNNSATFNITNGAANGCDSLVTLDLTIVNSTSGTDTRTECNFYTWIDGNTYTASNNSATFNIVGGAANGCDSLVTLDLTIVNSTSGTDTKTECNSYTWIDGNTYTASNNSATFNITNGGSNGCDSLVTLDLTIVNSTSGTDTKTECNSYTWIDGNTFTVSNNSATFNITNGAANGCDSLVTLDLTIVNSTTGTDTRTECDSYTAPDGAVYTSTGIYTAIISNAANCDSTITIDLTVNNSSTGSVIQTVCDTYTAPDGAVYTSTGMYTAIIPNAANCDSTITIDLTVNNSSTGSVIQTVCDTYTAPDGAVYTSTGNYTAVIPNAANCDSTITIDLTVNNSSTGSVIQTVCDTYTAPDGAVYTSTGIYTAIIPNAANCDSTITIDLTVNNATASSISETALDLYTAPSGAVYTTSGVFNDTIANAAGCDSVISITLTMSHTGIEELNHQPIFLTPNPTSDFITIVGLENVTEIKSMELVSSAGRVVAVLKVGTLKIDVSRLSSGAYFLSITHTNGTDRLRFVKE